MKVLIVGAGRMGQRHAVGIAPVKDVNHITLVDISTDALNTAEQNLKTNENAAKFHFRLFDKLGSSETFDIGIIASTAQNRVELCDWVVKKGCRFLLIEKPLGQSLAEVEQLVGYFSSKKDVKAFVNLNMRIYPHSIKLKNDLNTVPQLTGIKSITINTGTVGIGANGIHYLDFLFFLTDADRAELAAGEIEDITIPSARGPQFKDFGGWALIKLFRKQELKAKAFVSINPQSTVFGGWDIVCPHGRITINEANGKRVDHFRKADSTMPIQRYNADYNAAVESTFDSPFLGDLTRAWVEGLIKNTFVLPTLEESVPSHRLMFDWLSKSRDYKNVFPIT